jgi:hypothetical protein
MDFDDESVLIGVLLPVQFYSAASPTPYHHLLAAILEDAIRCFEKNCGARRIRRHTIFREAAAMSHDTMSHGSGSGSIAHSSMSHSVAGPLRPEADAAQERSAAPALSVPDLTGMGWFGDSRIAHRRTAKACREHLQKSALPTSRPRYA